jgi:Fic family protein
MGTYLNAHWDPTFVGGLPRRERRGGMYHPYVPDPLVGRPLALSSEVAADVSDAEHAIATLDDDATSLVDTEALARILLRAESVSSSKIEGLEVGPRRLLHADIAQEEGADVNDVTAEDVLGNVRAMDYAVHAVSAGEPITVDLLIETHRRLLQGTHQATFAGKIRDEQNWIGGSSHNPLSAAFVPPPPEYVRPLLDDLCAFCNSDSAPTVAQGGLAHAQFETIHPFADGNGRVGRALIHMVFRRRGLTRTVTPPVSLVLATIAKEYIEGLNAVHYEGDPKSESAQEGVNVWLGIFASACSRSVRESLAFEARIHEIEGNWRRRLGHIRSDSSLPMLLAKLPGTPIVTVASVQNILDCSVPTAVSNIERLEAAGILHKATQNRKRRIVYEARDVIEAFTLLERQLASPAGDTNVARPVRTVPARPTKREQKIPSPFEKWAAKISEMVAQQEPSLRYAHEDARDGTPGHFTNGGRLLNLHPLKDGSVRVIGLGPSRSNESSPIGQVNAIFVDNGLPVTIPMDDRGAELAAAAIRTWLGFHDEEIPELLQRFK